MAGNSFIAVSSTNKKPVKTPGAASGNVIRFRVSRLVNPSDLETSSNTLGTRATLVLIDPTAFAKNKTA